jgi:hypothetical protein
MLKVHLKNRRNLDQASRLFETAFWHGVCPQNIETILSHIRALCDVAGNGLIDGLSQKDLSNLDSEICKVITTAVK